MYIDQEAAETLDLALELYFAGAAETFQFACELAADIGPDLRTYASAYDRAVADAAALAGDAETCYAASPF